MKRFKNQSYLKHFPFLRELSLENSDITVKRLDENILSRSFQSSYHDGSCGSDREDITIKFIDDEGNIYSNVVKIGERWASNYAHSQSVDVAGETLAEAIDRFSNTIKFVVINFSGYSDWSGSENETWDSTTVYKTPKDQTIISIIEKFKKNEEIKVLGEISF